MLINYCLRRPFLAIIYPINYNANSKIIDYIYRKCMFYKFFHHKKILLLLYSLLLIAIFPICFFAFKKSTGSKGYIVSDPSNGNQLYLENYDLNLSGVDRKGCTYFFLPPYVSITNLDQSHSKYKLLKSDSSLLDTPAMDEVIDIYVDTGDAELVPWKISFLRSKNLCSVFLDTGSTVLEDISKENYQKVSLDIISPDGIVITRNIPVSIKGHGNSTWNCDKNPYELKFSRDISLCGMTSSKKWLLLANVFDGTKMANKLAFDTSASIGMAYSIESDWVDLYANDTYLGNYLLCKQPDIGRNDLNIGNLEPLNDPYWDRSQTFDTGEMKGFIYQETPSQISGGYLIEKNRSELYDDKKCGFNTDNDYFTIKSPNNASFEETGYIRSFTETVDASIRNTKNSIPDLIDPYSFTRRYLIEEIFFNEDSMFSSYYFYKKPGLERLFAGPVWDFDRSLGFESDDFALDPTSSVLDNGIYFSYDILDWDNLLYENDNYRFILKKTLNDNIPVFRVLVNDQIDKDFKRIEASLKMDYILWGTDYCKYESPYNNSRFIRYFLSKRLEHLCDAWDIDAEFLCDISNGTTHTVTFHLPDGSISDISVKDGELLSVDRSPFYDKEVYAGWCFHGTHKRFSFFLPILEDISLDLLPCSEAP